MSTEQKCDSRYTAERVRIHAVKRAKPLPGHGTLGTRRNAAPRAENTNPISSACSADRKVSLRVCLRTDRVGWPGKEHP
jgi:predicted PhzF superfamily epimerase YddE/YHI9